ncbi:uncharacterized protein LOC141595821 [Silene latifolia]|uniref:uncharacterized protein LOC141595821 n=1 Tax=Silene latifolia TaxID=37657 RepID=UPI003D782887
MIINLETLVKLPKYVQFRSENGKLLRAVELTYNLPAPISWKPTEELPEGGRYEFLKCSETNSTARATMFEVLDDLGDGSTGFKYAINGKIWGAPSIFQKWVLITYGINSVTNPRCQFEPIKTEEIDVIALKNYFHHAYIKKFTTFDYTDCFSAMGGTIDDTSRLRVEEPIKHRIVLVKKFRYEAFRIISDEKEAVIDSKEIVNRGDSELTETVKFTRYDEYETGKWTKTISIQAQTKFFFKSPFPVYKDGKFSDGYGEAAEKDYQWGKILERKYNMVTENYPVKVPARSVRTANLVARKIVFEIPFNFDQNDVNSINGESIMLDDQREGLYLGVLQFDYKIKTF